MNVPTSTPIPSTCFSSAAMRYSPASLPYGSPGVIVIPFFYQVQIRDTRSFPRIRRQPDLPVYLQVRPGLYSTRPAVFVEKRCTARHAGKRVQGG